MQSRQALVSHISSIGYDGNYWKAVLMCDILVEKMRHGLSPQKFTLTSKTEVIPFPVSQRREVSYAFY